MQYYILRTSMMWIHDYLYYKDGQHDNDTVNQDDAVMVVATAHRYQYQQWWLPAVEVLYSITVAASHTRPWRPQCICTSFRWWWMRPLELMQMSHLILPHFYVVTACKWSNVVAIIIPKQLLLLSPYRIGVVRAFAVGSSMFLTIEAV